MSAGLIRILGDISEQLTDLIASRTDEMPAPDAVRRVDGDATEIATARLTHRLTVQAARLADVTQTLREQVAADADALSAAVRSLRESDEISDREAAQGQNIIDGIAEEAPSSVASEGASSRRRIG